MNKYGFYETTPAMLDGERPLGVSGIMRCNNVADYAEACIESCISALDELVIVYHDCIDGTEGILYKKQKQYPGKIRIYPYEPYVYPIDLNYESFSEAMALPDTSVHLMSGYTNFAIAKTTYRYVVKIDADQIYFTGKFARICNAYRSTAKVKINLLESIAYNLHRAYNFSFHREEMKQHVWIERVATWMYPYYFSYVEKMVVNYKMAVSLSGINVYTDGKDWMVGLGDKDLGILPPFNGVRDLFFFEVSGKTFYGRLSQQKSRNYYRVLEVLRYNEEILDLGFFWFHLRAVTHRNKKYYQQLYESAPGRFIPLRLFRKDNYRTFSEKYRPHIAVSFAESIFSYFFTASRHEIPWNWLDKLLRIYNEYDDKKYNLMDKRDYYLEFHEQLDTCLHDFLQRQEEKMPSSFQIGAYSLKIPLLTYLFYQLMNQRGQYNECRKNGMGITESLSKIHSYLEHFTWEDKVGECPDATLQNHSWYDVLLPYRGQLLIYIYNQRQLDYLAPLIRHLNCPTILLCEYELGDDTDLPDCVNALTVEFSGEQYIPDTVVKQNFPLLFRYADTFEVLIRCLSPRCVICLEGCHYQEQLLAVVARGFGVPSIGIQQGWPSFMRTGFRQLPFEYYFTWGEKFNACWKKENPAPNYVGTGYMYEVERNLQSRRNCISFFLQGPLFLSNETYRNELVNLIREQATAFPDQTFLVREHPEFRLPETVLNDFSRLSNVEIVSTKPLKEVYGRSLVVVSHFSSSIMECLIHGAIPLVYDPTTNSRYYPDIEAEQLGLIAKTPGEFNTKLLHITENYTLFQDRILERINLWFANTDIGTLDAMKQYIMALCPTLSDDSNN